MRLLAGFFLAGCICVLLMTAGCTSSPAASPVTATPVTTESPAEPVLLPGTQPLALPSTPSWSGMWDSSYSSEEYGQVADVLNLTQEGMSVTGTYNEGKGTIDATVQDGILAGTWHDSDANGTYNGFFEFELSADGASFTGRWVNISDGADAVKNTARFWNGERL
jgi:hypothetical protein